MNRQIAFVVPRFGEEIGGGAETLARGFALQASASGLARVEVFTTCARSYRSWRNELPTGTSYDHGIAVHRFKVDGQRRNAQRYIELNIRVIDEESLTLDEQLDWVANSVQSPSLYAALEQAQNRFDFVFCIPYLFGTTFYSAAACPDKAILWPCLHDEPYARLPLVRHLFQGCLGIAYNAVPEQTFAESLYGPHPGAQVIGAGIQPPAAPSNAQRFRSKHNIHNPFILYVGRLEVPKNVDLLVAYFDQYKLKHPGPLKLVLMGDGPVTVGHNPDVMTLGFQPEQDKIDAMAAAMLLCQPSTNESFSIVIMEAWQQGTPVLVHADCAVTRHHAVQSNGGLYFANQEEFDEAINWMLSKEADRQSLGRSGQRYVAHEYNWDVVLGRFEAAMCFWDELRAKPSPQPPPVNRNLQEGERDLPSPVLTGEGSGVRASVTTP
jgi:glycosyltransferase involved in cell wall biosynthesis